MDFPDLINSIHKTPQPRRLMEKERMPPLQDRKPDSDARWGHFRSVLSWGFSPRQLGDERKSTKLLLELMMA